MRLSLKKILICGMFISGASQFIVISVLLYHSYSRATAQIIGQKTTLLIIAQEHPEFIDNLLPIILDDKHGVFFNIVEPATDQVISATQNKKYPALSKAPPPHFFSSPSFFDATAGGIPLKEITVMGKDGKGLWLGISFEEERQAVLYLMRLSLILALIFVGGGSFFLFIILSRFYFKPIAQLVLTMRLYAKRKNTKLAPLQKQTFKEINDITQAFNALIEHFTALRERDATISRLKSEFISITAHQLRTPLSVLKWTLRLLIDEEMGAINSNQKEFLEKSYETNERMIHLINELLNVARIEEGKFEYAFASTDFAELVQNLITNEYQIAAQKKNITFTYKIPRNIPNINIDVDKMKLALANLFDNALHYTKHNGFIEISLHLYKKQQVELIVKDSGVGIPNSQINRVFDKFFRGYNVAHVDTGGSGLGLFITKNIIEKHGGKIRLESEEGKGTTVYVALPLKKRAGRKKEKVRDVLTAF